MAKIVVNKNFQSKYLYRAYERLIKPDYSINTNIRLQYQGSPGWATSNLTLVESPIQCYNDLSSVYKTTWAGVDTTWESDSGNKLHLVPHQYFLCDETFITLLNKINKIAKDGMTAFPKTVNATVSATTVTSSNKTANLNIMLLVSSLFSAKRQVRDYAIDYFVSANIISLSEGNQIKSILSTFNLVDNNVSIDTYGGTYVPKVTDINSSYNNGSIDISINKTLRLDNPYISSENLLNTNLYILVIPYSDTKFIDGYTNKILRFDSNFDLNTLIFNGSGATQPETATGTVLTGYNTFHRKDTNTVVNQIPYIALSLTETGLGGDIEYDHLDEIEYLDEIKVTIALPKEYI